MTASSDARLWTILAGMLETVVNRRSIGIDISNAVYPKYQKYYEKRWGREPEIKAVVHGREYELLGYYDAQIGTAASFRIYSKALRYWLVTPDSTTVISKPHLYKGISRTTTLKTLSGTWRGFHLTRFWDTLNPKWLTDLLVKDYRWLLTPLDLDFDLLCIWKWYCYRDGSRE